MQWLPTILHAVDVAATKSSVATRTETSIAWPVAAHSGFVAIEDDQIGRILHPAAAIELAALLIQATRGHYRAAVVGPLSGKF